VRTTNPASIGTVDGVNTRKRNHLSQVVDTLIVGRWELDNALHDTIGIPDIVTARMKRTRAGLDVSISTLKSVLEEQGLPL
jgi:hypothetical protein